MIFSLPNVLQTKYYLHIEIDIMKNGWEYGGGRSQCYCINNNGK